LATKKLTNAGQFCLGMENAVWNMYITAICTFLGLLVIYWSFGVFRPVLVHCIKTKSGNPVIDPQAV
jgi:hypothetical protein